MTFRSGDAGDRLRVVLLGLDGFPISALSPGLTPTLWSLLAESSGAVPTGICSLPATTYPGFASLLTGVIPTEHGVRLTGFRPGAVPGWAGDQKVRVPTLFDVAKAAGRRAVAVVGDQNLFSVLRLESADAAGSWPGAARLPDGTETDVKGYATNAAVRPHLLAAAADVTIDLVFGHLNEADTFGHREGPRASATLDCVRRTDALVADLLDALQPAWERTVLIITSDHDMDAVAPEPAVGLADLGALDELIGGFASDGGSALLRPRPGEIADELVKAAESVPMVAVAQEDDWGLVVVGLRSGRHFPLGHPDLGFHGGPATARTLAMVAGGPSQAVDEARRMAASQPHVAQWAQMVASALNLPWSLPRAHLRAGRRPD